MDTNKRTLGQARAEFQRIGMRRPSMGPSARRREFPDVLGEMDKPLSKQNYKGGMVDEKSPTISRGSAGRESAEQQRKREQRERSKPDMSRVMRVPLGDAAMPSKKSMVREGRMDLANNPNPEFGKEMARERRRQQREYSGY
jgi:hypothetical protein